VRAYKNSHANKSQKMLASTVQFSTYDQTSPTCPRQTPTHDPGGTRSRKTLNRSNGRPFPQDPTACLRPRTLDDPVPHATESDAVLGAGNDRRPNWSAFHPRAPPHTLRRHPQMGTDHGVGAALHHPPKGRR
jgi:hypothetical protein